MAAERCSIRSLFAPKFKVSKKAQPIFSVKCAQKFLCRKKFYGLTYISIGAGIVAALYCAIYWQIESSNIRNENQLIAEAIAADTLVIESDGFESTEAIESEEPEAADNGGYTNPYWSYLNTDISAINFASLKSVNPQTVAWLKVNGTNINYPVVQTSDNDYYLSHSFNGSNNSHGWVFMDYEDSPDFSSQNTVIYAHGRPEGDMFGTLKETLSNTWRDEHNNHIVETVTTQGEVMLWEVFSTYIVETTNDYIQTSFASNRQFESLLNTIKSRSNFDYGVPLDSSDKILTLSTCYDQYSRMVLHAKLI